MIHDSDILVILLSSVPLLVLLACVYFDREHGLLSPFLLMIYCYGIGFPVKAFGHYLGVRQQRPEIHFGGLNTMQLLSGCIAVSTFLLFMALGYFLVNRVRRPVDYLPPPRLFELNGQLVVVWTGIVMFASGLALYLFLKEAGADFSSLKALSSKRWIEADDGTRQSGGLYRVIIDLTRFNTLILIAMWMRNAPSRGRVPILFGIALGVLFSLATAFLLSARVMVLLLAVPLLGALKKERAIGWTGIVFAGAAMLVFASFLWYLRVQKPGGRVDLASILQEASAPSFLIENLDGPELTKMARIVIHYDSWDAQHRGFTFISWVPSLVPRSLWPDKPNYSVGDEITSEVYGLIPNVQGGSIPPSLPGEMFMNLGWLGVVAGGVVCGCLLRSIMNTCYPVPEHSILRTAIFLMVLPVLGFNMQNNSLGGGLIVIVLGAASIWLLWLGYRSLALIPIPQDVQSPALQRFSWPPSR